MVGAVLTSRPERQMIYQAVNMSKDEVYAPVIYWYSDDSGTETGTYRSWQAADGSSRSGDLETDRMECAAEIDALSRMTQAAQN